eukprot:RCo000511
MCMCMRGHPYQGLLRSVEGVTPPPSILVEKKQTQRTEVEVCLRSKAVQPLSVIFTWELPGIQYWAFRSGGVGVDFSGEGGLRARMCLCVGLCTSSQTADSWTVRAFDSPSHVRFVLLFLLVPSVEVSVGVQWQS